MKLECHEPSRLFCSDAVLGAVLRGYVPRLLVHPRPQKSPRKMLDVLLVRIDVPVLDLPANSTESRLDTADEVALRSDRIRYLRFDFNLLLLSERHVVS